MADHKRIFISVAEDSADLHAARLVRTARELGHAWEFLGLTGPRLRAAGVESVADLTASAAMLANTVSQIGRARQALAACEESWRQRRPDLVIVMDSSALHLSTARLAKRQGLKVLYYIAPQTWASRPWRLRTIRKYVDRVACILPFEEKHFHDAGINAEFVGHPLFESLADERPDERRIAHWRRDHRPVIALLPGSRKHVIDTMLPLQLDVIRRMRRDGHALRPLVSCVSPERKGLVQRIIGERHDDAEVVVADNASLLTAADLVLVASGTATLHVAHYRKPMVVMYDAGRVLYWPHRLFGRLIINLPHLSLVNILAQARVVPEFMPFVRETAPIATVAGQLLTDEPWRALMIRQMDDIVRPLSNSTASRRVCELVVEMLVGRITCATAL
ncbi:MAG: hypothetical protein JXO22_12780 [Phycisphaerae bacterium]|nr:hypothetical protein [Phycisphaerae bacterium]